MTTPSPHEVTQLLLAWGQGDETALERLIPIVYDELRRLAKRCLRRERPGHICKRPPWSTRLISAWSK